MKRYIFTLILLAVSAVTFGADHLRERVYLTTDKSVYVAGDRIWCSAFCIDANTGTLSTFSDIAYLEFHSSEGTVQTGKIALENGRGAGTFTLDASLATGNYQVIAYTAQSCNEKGYDYFACAKTISVFNTLSNNRVKDGVKVVNVAEYPKYDQAISATGLLGIEGPMTPPKSSTATLTVTNNSQEEVSVSFSVYHNDGISAVPYIGLGEFISSLSSLKPAEFTASRIPEYEGEIIRTHLVGVAEDKRGELVGGKVFICVPDRKPNLYLSEVDANLKASFFTDNMYGNKDLFVGVDLNGISSDCHLETESPFVNPLSGDAPVLYMRRDFENALAARSAAMQIESIFNADTLYEMLPVHQRLLMDNAKTYNLDDYTRFPVMEEIFIEFISEVKIIREKKRPSFLVTMSDAFRGGYYSNMPALVMIDGVPVFDTEKVLAYDPLLVKQVDVYQKTYHVGNNIFGGAINLITYKGDLPSFQFDNSVRVVNFQGASYPLAYTCKGVSSDYPDYRQTIYWQPLLSLKPGQSIDILCKTPSYTGDFDIVVEGVTQSMKPIFETASFTIEQ